VNTPGKEGFPRIGFPRFAQSSIPRLLNRPRARAWHRHLACGATGRLPWLMVVSAGRMPAGLTAKMAMLPLLSRETPEQKRA
jgi:hypothetical protein